MTDSGTDGRTDGRTGVSKERAIAYMLSRAKNPGYAPVKRHRAVLPVTARLLFSYLLNLIGFFQVFSVSPSFCRSYYKLVFTLTLQLQHRYLNHLLHFSFIFLNFLSYFSYSLIFSSALYVRRRCSLLITFAIISRYVGWHVSDV